MQSPKSARFLGPDETDHPAARAALLFVNTIQEALFGGGADLFPAIITNTNGTEDIVLVVSADQSDGTAGYGVAALMFSEEGSSPLTKELALAIRAKVVEALDAQLAVEPEPETFEEALPGIVAEEQLAVDSNRATDERYAAEDD